MAVGFNNSRLLDLALDREERVVGCGIRQPGTQLSVRSSAWRIGDTVFGPSWALSWWLFIVPILLDLVLGFPRELIGG